MRPINAFLAAAAKSSMFRSALAARRWLLLMLATLSVATGPMATAGSPLAYPMNADTWTMAASMVSMGGVAGSAKFARYEGMPTGTMTLNEGVAVSNAAHLSQGTIEFDIKPLGYNDAGVIFHRHGALDGEFFYLRANPDCPAADDCIQYAPITHGLMAWNIYPNYQRPAQISPTGWNHVRLVVAEDSLQVYLNHSIEPSLVVPKLRALSHDGGLGFKGPAIYANLVVTPSEWPILPAVVAETVEPGTVTSWLAAPPTAHDRAQAVVARDEPPAAAWSPIEAEATGLVNLGRAFEPAQSPSLSLGWLKTSVTASAPMGRILRLGFAPQLWVFLNGSLVYSGVNSYFPAEDRLSPDGRLDAENASVHLDLRQGANEIVLAVGNDWRPHGPTPMVTHYGWGAEAHFDHMSGLTLH
jgi:hypothetical protein